MDVPDHLRHAQDDANTHSDCHSLDEHGLLKSADGDIFDGDAHRAESGFGERGAIAHDEGKYQDYHDA